MRKFENHVRSLRPGRPIPEALDAEGPNLGVDSRSWLFLLSGSPGKEAIERRGSGPEDWRPPTTLLFRTAAK